MKSYRNYPTEQYENLKQLYHASAEKFGDKIFAMEKINGEYQGVSFSRYAEDVDALGTELCARGLSGKRVIVTGENCYAWITAYMAVTCGVGVVVPVDKEIPAEEIANIANIAEASAVIYSAKYAEKINVIDPKVMRICFDELPDLIRSGNDRIIQGNHTYLKAEIDPNAMGSLIFTSGTTGVSKGVMLSHRNLCFNLSEMCQMIYIDTEDRFLSVLPLHHVYECTCGFLCPLYRGSSLAFSEGLRHITRNLKETSPTVVLCVPLLMETMYHKVWANIRKQGLEKKVTALINTTNAIPSEKLRDAAKRKLFAKIHENFGGKLRIMISGGAAADPIVLKGLRDFGIHTYQGYGLTECAPLAALNREHFFNDASAGMATPNALLDIYDVQDDGTGEIRYKGDNIMLGYYKMPELTREVIRDGWFYTGDLGYLDENGFLYITGRKKNVIVTSGGKNIFPEELETYLGRNPYVKESVVVGYVNKKKNDYDIVAIIYPDYEKMEETYGKNFVQSQLDLELKKAISEVNGIVQSYKRIEYYVIRREEFPKNSSRKIKRKGIADSAYEEYKAKLKD
ncbi:MAG: AMP-binding protein [Clostridia bacterium]|nr:AMP-binding protein [Clostridia bacterium]